MTAPSRVLPEFKSVCRLIDLIAKVNRVLKDSAMTDHCKTRSSVLLYESARRLKSSVAVGAMV
jgi:hypothetical protein